MKNKRSRRQEAESLRRRAEERLREHETEAAPRPPPDLERLVHELEVHRVELGMQNEELRAARDDREAALERQAALFDYAPIGYFVLGSDGLVQQCNFAAARLLGAERQRLVGKPFALSLSEHVRPAWREFFARLLSSDEDDCEPSALCELTLETGNERLAVKVTASRLEHPLSALVAVEDITGRQRAEAGFRDESRQKDDFLALLSHELRNPLAPIRNSLFILGRAEPGGEKARGAIAVIERQAEHLTRIVDDLLDVTRIARGKVHLQPERLELGELVRRTLDDHRAGFDANGIALEAHLGPEPFWVDADPTRLAQVLGNLLGNAAKFTSRGGRVVVALRQERHEVALSVRDTGAGIAPDVLAHLFEPFRQAPQTLDRSRGGLGLGLAMAKGLVALHGGTIEAASGGTGRGAELTVRLPLQSGPSAAGPRPPESSRGSRRRILVIEDNPDASESLRDALELGGHDVVVARDGPTGLSLARVFQPEIILCDIGLPGMSGYDVARALRAEGTFRNAYLIALSGYALPEDLKRAADSGFDRHLAKPPTMEKLERAIAGAPAEDAATLH